MVSGLVTSPCDQLRIFSGEARLIRMASKSAIGFPRSKGLERYKVFLRFLRHLRCRGRLSQVLSSRFSVLSQPALIHSCFAEPRARSTKRHVSNLCPGCVEAGSRTQPDPTRPALNLPL